MFLILEEEITLKKIEELGEIVKFDNTYFPDAMLKQLSKGCSGFKCQGSKAGQALLIFHVPKVELGVVD